MPRWKYLANRFLTRIENRIMGTELSEAHTGYRAYSRRLLLTVPFLRNSLDFAFDSELLMQASHFGFEIKEVPARCRYFDEASSVGFWSGVVYGLKTLWVGFRLLLHRWELFTPQVPAPIEPSLPPCHRRGARVTTTKSSSRWITLTSNRCPIRFKAHSCSGASSSGSTGSVSGSREGWALYAASTSSAAACISSRSPGCRLSTARYARAAGSPR